MFIYIEISLRTFGQLLMCSKEGYFGVCFPSCEGMREINTKITLRFVTMIRTLMYFLHDMMIPFMPITKTIFIRPHHAWLGLFTLPWWRHKWLSNAADDVTIGTAIVTRGREQRYPINRLLTNCLSLAGERAINFDLLSCLHHKVALLV